jgi:hypothetical protein
MNELPVSADVNRKRFRYGVLLAWVPVLILVVPGILSMVSVFDRSKTTGLGAVAGGWSQGFTMFGLVTFVAAQVAAIILLGKSFSETNRSQRWLAVLTIIVSLLFLAMCFGSLWLVYHFSRR